MKAALIDRYGGLDVFTYGDFPDPVAARGEVVVKVAAASVNPVDLLDRSGGTKDWRPLQFPAVIGWDVSGEVSALGEGVTGFALGDRVIGWAFRTYAEYVAVNAELLVQAPGSLDLAEAAALPLAGMTGTQLVSLGAKVQPGQTVLVAGALGAVGRAAVFAAKDSGAKVIAGVRASQLQEGRALGVDEVLALDDEDAVANFGAVDVVANTLRGAAAEQVLKLLAPGGVFASVTGPPANAEARPDAEVIAFVSKQLRDNLAYVAKSAAEGRLVIPVSLKLPLADAAVAHERMTKGGVGKIILLP